MAYTASHTDLMSEYRMNDPTHDIRAAKVNRIIKDTFAGNGADFARAIDRAPSLVHQWIKRHRNIGERSARHIERELGLEPYTLDKNEDERFVTPSPVTSTTGLLHKTLQQMNTIEQQLSEQDYHAQSLILEARLSVTRLIDHLTTEND